MNNIKSLDVFKNDIKNNPNDILSYFPHTSFRNFQEKVLQTINDIFYVKNKPFVVFEGPTGFGKTPVAMAAGFHSKNSYLLTSQKTLQNQYREDYEKFGLKILKGRGNYPCVARGGEFTCKDCLDSEYKNCIRSGICPYLIAKQSAISSPIAGLNYAYFFNVTKCDPANSFSTRKLLICDEAHSLEKILMSHIEFSISQYSFAKNLDLKIDIPTFNSINNSIVWVEEIHEKIKFKMKDIAPKIEHLNSIPASRFNYDNLLELQSLKEIYDDLDRINRKIKMFLNTYHLTEWIFYQENFKKSFKGNERSFTTMVFKPVSVELYTKE
ncbi:MAG: DEAD/DEAH box helicase family protein, partial [Acidithiobacillus sp.]|uniref:DEAD/DEAH box helicase family protein n=1 Tax=Acidithiobacillus sp. TaxID=1872118 RepID=UPI00355E84FD